MSRSHKDLKSESLVQELDGWPGKPTLSALKQEVQGSAPAYQTHTQRLYIIAYPTHTHTHRLYITVLMCRGQAELEEREGEREQGRGRESEMRRLLSVCVCVCVC